LNKIVLWKKEREVVTIFLFCCEGCNYVCILLDTCLCFLWNPNSCVCDEIRTCMWFVFMFISG